ncbi:tyrosine-type recombinase/integrase [Microbulbifer taiwanensis]|uniref:Tyrosine-type recombinase/integrase n=1 Tax=Microbulbifer taiwanensis TaxID=986746 RepID=A0ABW1YKE3_9GAMM|nr:integrase arm-type DNA-binding domain-containing protein [Microbulbifer taiwanensis]
MAKLKPKQVENLSTPGTYEDGDGLRLVVKANGSRSWVFRYQLNGKRREMGLGSVPAVSLKQARVSAAAQRGLILNGVDPVEERRAQRAAMLRASKEKTQPSFSELARAYIEAQRPGWKSAKHAQQWENTLEKFAFPVIGRKQAAEITTEDVLAVLTPIWHSKPETARRVRNRIEIILNAAKAQGLRQGENVAAWRGHLELLLTRQKQGTRGHHAALPWKQAPEFWSAIATHEDLSAAAVRLTILTTLRTAEVLGATWKEINLEGKIWMVPGERMKAGKNHRVPLSPAAVAELKRLPRVESCDYLFPGARAGRPLSNMAMLMKIRGLDEIKHAEDSIGWRDENGSVITMHGFRSAFRDWAAECSKAPNHVCEMALAHTIGDDVEAAYRRGDLLELRRQLMREWADFVTASRKGKILEFHTREVTA